VEFRYFALLFVKFHQYYATVYAVKLTSQLTATNFTRKQCNRNKAESSVHKT